uniref:Patatin n=1 Tax=Chlamydomonas leiostraca TaxID=1034604 RepID=A0A7S0WPM6_9CHLO|mmetsp:Transcript_22348/g.56876  ORF Transcript_22348/g.56876 Transcript_22348/m.56876 type:complete len:337 (+) Transcript_22348:86-1096(+)
MTGPLRTTGGASTSGCSHQTVFRPRLFCARPRNLVSRALSEREDFGRSGEKVDLILSSGFLAFANHSGFLQAVEEAGLRVGGVMGTSAGALAGSLYCAGYKPHEVAEHLSSTPPISFLRPSLAPWRGGLLSLDGVVERLRELLPATFEELNMELAVGVVTADGRHQLIDSGPLPEAVAASAAIPFVFQSVDIPGHTQRNPYKDGGVVDRIGLAAWRDRRRSQLKAAGLNPARVPPALVHVISRSSPFSGFDDVGALSEPQVCVVRSPKAGVNFFSLGDFEGHMSASRQRARPVLVEALTSGRVGGGVSAGAVAGAASAAARGDQRSPERKRFVSTA